MVVDSQLLLTMLSRIAEFFRFMSDNKEQRPIQQVSPYAYQHVFSGLQLLI
jgi:hypothetical protein